MSGNRLDLSSALASARQQLNAAQARVAALEAQLFEDRQTPLATSAIENPYYHIFDSMLEGCQIIGFDWRYRYVNDTATRYGQVAKDELLGYTMMEQYPGIEKTQMFAVLQRSMQERTVERMENEFSYPDGTVAWFELNIQPVPEGVFILLRDITERKHAEQALRESEEKYRALFQNAQVGMYRSMLDGSAMLEINQKFADIFGCSIEEILSKPATIRWADPAKRTEMVQRLSQDGVLNDYEVDILTKSGEIRTVLASAILSAETGYLGGSVVDITERKRLEQQLSQSEERYRLLVNHSPYAIGVHQDGKIVFANPAAAHLWGAETVNELIGKPIEAFVHPDNWEATRDRVSRMLKGEKGVYPVEDRYIRLDKSIVPVEVIAAPFLFMGRPAIQIILQDITERKRTEVALRRSSERLAIINRLDHIISSNLDLSLVYDSFVKELHGLIPVDRTSIVRLNESGDQWQVTRQWTRHEPVFHPGVWRQVQGSVIEWLITHKTPFLEAEIGKRGNWPETALLQREGIRSRLLLPLISQERITGILTVASRQPSAFSEEDQSLLMTFADQLAIAIQNSELYEQVQRRAAALEQNNADLIQTQSALKRYAQRIEILHQIDTGIINANSIPEVIEAALKNLRQIILCQRVSIILFDWVTNEWLIFADDANRRYSLGREIRTPIPPRWDDGFGTETSRILDDLRLAQPQMPHYQPLIKDGLVSGIQALFVIQGQRIGLLGLNADTPGFFTAEHKEIATQIASQLAIAIHQMQLSEEMAHHSRVVEGMSKFLQTTQDAFPANTTVLDPDGKIITVNRPWKQFADDNDGNAVMHYLGANYLTVCESAVGPMSEEAAPAAAGIRSVIAGRRDEFQLEYPCNSLTEERWFTLRVTPFAESAPRRVVVAHIDITKRKVAEQALLANEEKYRSLIDSSDAVIAMFDVQGKLLYANQIAAFALHVTMETLVGKNMTDLFPAPIAQYQLESIQQVIKTGKGSVTEALTSVFGDERWYRTSVQPVRDASGNVIAALINATDITPFKEVEASLQKAYDTLENRVTERTAELQAAKERVEAILNNSVDGILLLHPEFNIQQTNSSFNRLFACEPDDYFGKAPITLVQSEDADKVRNILQTVATEQQGKSIEVRALRQDGTVFDAELGIGYIKTDGLVCTIRDVTERKMQEHQLRYHARLQENVSDAVIVTDMEFRIKSWNNAAERIYGWKAGEIANKATPEILHTEYPSAIDQQGAIKLLREKGWWQGEVIQHHKDGSIRYILGSVTLIKDENGLPFSVISVNHDITERKQTEDLLRQSEERFSLIFRLSPIAIALTTAAEGRYLDVNDSLLKLLGYSRDEMIGRTAIELSVWETPEKRAAAVRTIRQDGSVRGLEVGFRNKTGDVIRNTLTSIVPVILNSQSCFLSIIYDITERKRAEEALNAKVEEEREFQNYLKALHEITIELTQIDELDIFYKRAVEFGLERLGFERLAMFLYDEQDGSALGTYGTNPQGQIVDERHIRFTPDPNAIMLRAFNRVERFYFDERVPLYKDMKPVGMGWNAAAVLWNGKRSLGWFVADNLLRQTPASKALLDILGLYALTVGTLMAQKQIQITLRESEGRYRLLAENITDLIVRSNSAGEYLYVSPSSRTVLGYEPSELLGHFIPDYIHPDDLDAIGQAFTATIEHDLPNVSMILRFRHKQGHYIWLETIGRATHSDKTGDGDGFISSSRDISDRKRAEEALRESEEKYRSLIDTMRGGFVMFDLDNRITYINDRFCELLGYSRNEVIETRAADYVDATNLPILKTHLERRRQSESSTYELLFRHKNGGAVYMLVSGTPLLGKNGEFNGSFAVTTDITAQKQAEETLRQALAKEIELNELKSRFVSMASHEFRTPLASILAATETLTAYRHRLTDDEIGRKLSAIVDQVGFLKAIMDDVLQLARLQARRLEYKPLKLDLNALWREVLDEFQSRPDITHHFFYTCENTLPAIPIDKKLMRQIVSNLLSNAIKYSPPEKIITIKLEQIGDCAVFSVQDGGIGIPHDDLQHLFEPFHRATNVGTIHGTGLGLVIAKEAVDLHGGTINVESQIDIGTKFTVQIPITS